MDLTGTLIVLAIFQVLAAPHLWAGWGMWWGKETSWLEDRKRRSGGAPFSSFAVAAPFQFMVFLIIAMSVPERFQDPLGIATVVGFLVVFPLLLVFGSWWAPRWVLPGWIRERLDAGDSARSAFPAAELVPLMRYEQNRPDLVLLPTAEQLELPTRLPVNRVRWGSLRWWCSGWACSVCWRWSGWCRWMMGRSR